MKFSEVLEGLEQGRRFRRKLWVRLHGEAGGYLALVRFDDHQGIPVQPLLMVALQGEGGWIWRSFGKTDWDLLAEDWEEVQ